VDGPAAAGKGTLARRLAAELGLPYLDTGLLYRAVGRRVLDRGGDPRDPALAAAEAAALLAADLDRPDLRGPEADMAASAVAVIPEVRAALLDWQRAFGQRHGAVMDGRDIGTVIFRDAPVKLFVTASPEARARRRHAELLARGVVRDLAEVEAEMRARDAQDAGRPTAPMQPAPDAVLLDTTALDAEAAFRAALEIVRDRLPPPLRGRAGVGGLTPPSQPGAPPTPTSLRPCSSAASPREGGGG
jgi:cytidylate kinase